MQEKYNVTGMTFAACQARVQKSVSNLTGVQECNVNLLKNSIDDVTAMIAGQIGHTLFPYTTLFRSEERRVGKEWML